jgi:hypothetical protein
MNALIHLRDLLGHAGLIILPFDEVTPSLCQPVCEHAIVEQAQDGITQRGRIGRRHEQAIHFVLN